MTISRYGYATTGFGERFFDDAVSLCRSIRFSYDTTNFAIITSPAETRDTNNMARCGRQCRSCHLIPFATNASLTNPHDRYNVDVMLSLPDVLPFAETIFFDSDVLRTRQCSPWASKFPAHRSQPVVMLGVKEDCDWHFGMACKLQALHQQPFPVRHARHLNLKNQQITIAMLLHSPSAGCSIRTLA